jgi:hypothetical protein
MRCHYRHAFPATRSHFIRKETNPDDGQRRKTRERPARGAGNDLSPEGVVSRPLLIVPVSLSLVDLSKGQIA